MLFPKLESVRLKVHQVLHEPGDSLKSAYFCNTGLISILSVFEDGKSVEVGLVGKEGFIGLPLVAGFRTALPVVIWSGYPADIPESLRWFAYAVLHQGDGPDVLLSVIESLVKAGGISQQSTRWSQRTA